MNNIPILIKKYIKIILCILTVRIKKHVDTAPQEYPKGLAYKN